MATDSAKINFIIIAIVSLLFIQIGLFSFFSSNLKDNTSELSSLKEEVNIVKDDVSSAMDGFTSSQALLEGRFDVLRDDFLRWDVLARGNIEEIDVTSVEKKSFAYYQSGAWANEIAKYIDGNTRRFLHTGTAAGRIFDGRGGVDTLDGFDGKYLFLNGFNFKSIEKFKLDNGVENVIAVTIPGLNYLERNEIEILGDDDLDKVLLDGCLSWTEEYKGNNTRRFKATDSKGHVRFVNILGEISVKIEQNCRQNYTTEHLIANARNTVHAFDKIRQQETSKEPIDYAINQEGNLQIYKSWLEKIEEGKVKEKISVLVDLMEEGKIPTEFPRTLPSMNKKSLMQMLYFDPEYMQKQDVWDKLNCHSGRGKTMLITNGSGQKNINCSWNNQIYVLSDEGERLDDSWGDDIVFPGKGNDVLDLHWGQDIVVLEKGWGHKTISKTCHHAKVYEDELYSDYRFRFVFMGVGINYKKNNDTLYVNGVLSGGAAEKAGIAKGDRILSIDDVAVSTMSIFQTLRAFRDGENPYVTLTYLDHDEKTQKTAKIKKQITTTKPRNNHGLWPSFDKDEHKFQKIKYKWPFEFTNLIIFGKGIKYDDMEWVGSRVLKNKETGDEIKFTGKQCFDFVYSDDGQKDASVHDEVSVKKNPEPEHKDIAESEPQSEPAAVQEKAGKGKVGNYEDVSDFFARVAFRAGLKKDQYLQSFLRGYKRLVGENGVINDEAISMDIKKAVKQAVLRQRNQILNYDSDLNGEVTMNEIIATIESNAHTNKSHHDRVKKRTLQKMEKHDLNGDQTITNEEMIVLDNSEKMKIEKRTELKYAPYWEVDLNEDGKVTEEEVATSAENAFDIIDLDGDGTLSKYEINQIQQAKRAKAMLAIEQARQQRAIKLQKTKFSDMPLKVKKAAMEIKSINAAVSTFRDMYDAYPGDMANAFKRIPNCIEKNCGEGNGDSKIGESELSQVEPYKDERHLFWLHLNKADLLGRLNMNKNDKDPKNGYPASSLGGFYQVYWYNAQKPLPNGFGATPRPGHYVILANDVTGTMVGKDVHLLSSSDARDLDRKLDDGSPTTGGVIAVGQENCLKKVGNGYAYTNDNEKKCLSLFVRIR